MNAIEQTYISLLADVAHSSGFSEIRGSYEGLQWCIYDAPKLEKQILSAVELGVEPDWAVWPKWLLRLARGSLVDPLLMRSLRQLLLFCYKAYITHDENTTARSFSLFAETNHSVGRSGNCYSTQSPSLINTVRRHVQSVLYKFDASRIVPKHGPGAVTTSKSEWLHIYSTIEYLFPYSDWFCLRQSREAQEGWDTAEHLDLIKAKLIAVPKDSRGPRLICVHPAEAIWIQQGVRLELERCISLKRFSPGIWPRGYINFEDQTVNGRIAKASSRNRRYATIDMKEASDRISDVLVQTLFGRYYKYFGCCRAQVFQVMGKDNKVRAHGQLHCYAPMGNATTFPVQSLIFWAICVASLQRQGFRQPGAAFVFGDDLEVPTECAEGVMNDLESFGLKVNKEKSFFNGAFRESCGVDAFNGINVTPIRWKSDFNSEGLHGMQSLSDLAMRLRIAGYEEAASTAYRFLHRNMRSRYGKRVFFTNNREHGGIAEYTANPLLVWDSAKWQRSYQQWIVPVWRLKVEANDAKTSHWNAILESLCSLEHTARSNIPSRPSLSRVRLELGYSPVVW